MSTQYMKNPRTVKLLAEEIKKLTDDYWARQVDERTAKDIVLYWASNEGKKLFKANEFNSTITKIVGSKRIDLISKWLIGTQYTF